tara:strand:+ start:1967 stop:2326 length:360 start_codon:yes stop_codon:yes gene_type:complete
MHGKIDPEERVMNDIPKHDWTKNTDEFFAWEDGGVMDRVQDIIEVLGWDPEDEIDVEIGGTQVSGIDVGEEYNKKWQSPLGTRKYNKDAFIIIKNQSRRDLTKSQPFPEGEFTPAHPLN